MNEYFIWRRQHESGGWKQTSHTLKARSDGEAQSKMRRMFASAGFHSMALIAIRSGVTP